MWTLVSECQRAHRQHDQPEDLGCRWCFPLLGVSLNHHGVTLKNPGTEGGKKNQKSTKCKDNNSNKWHKSKPQVQINHKCINHGLCRYIIGTPVLQLRKLPPVRTVLPPSAAGELPWWPTCSQWRRMGDPGTESPPTGWTSPWEESPPTCVTQYNSLCSVLAVVTPDLK